MNRSEPHGAHSCFAFHLFSLAFLGFTFTLHTTSGAYRACPSSVFTITQQPFATRRSGRHTPYVAVVRE